MIIGISTNASVGKFWNGEETAMHYLLSVRSSRVLVLSLPFLWYGYEFGRKSLCSSTEKENNEGD